MATAQKSSSGRIDMKHGFMKSIIKNQVARDNYDKEVKASKVHQKRGHFNLHPRSPKKPDLATYIPPCRKEIPEDTELKKEDESSISSEEEPDNLPKTLFCFEFEDKDGKIYKQYVKEGVRAEILAQRMGYDRRLTPAMIKALEQRLQQEIDKRTKKKPS